MLMRQFRWSARSEATESSNLVVISGLRELPRRPAAQATGPHQRWTIRGQDGTVHGQLSSRAEAVRTMSVLALRGAPVPLLVLDPDGQPTGDRLA